MRKILVKLLVTAAVGSVCIVGSAFAGHMHHSGDQVKKIFNNAFMYKHSNFGPKYMKKDSNNVPKKDKLSSFLAMNDNGRKDWRDCDVPWVKNGHGHNSSGTPPVPEPATMLLVGTGLVGLIGVARRNARKK